MGLLLVMLLVAMIPTGSYDWPSGRYYNSIDHTSGPDPSDYAICYLRPQTQYLLTFVSMILSVFLLGVGFLIRAVKLHKSLSVFFVESVRRSISVFLRRQLSRIYNKMNLAGSSPRLRLARTLIYRPLLAAFLVLRVGVDAWTSMTVEVCINCPGHINLLPELIKR
jgi:hypothetical protein